MGGAAIASCTQTAPPTGGVDVYQPSPTIVSLNPCTDAILLEVAEPGQLLAISHYSQDPRATSLMPEQTANFDATGGTVEEIIALDPDIVIAGSFIAPATLQALNDLGFRVELFGSTNQITESYAQIRAIGELAGHEDRAETLISHIEQSLDAVLPETGHDPISAVLWQPGQIVPGEATLVSELMNRTGFGSHSQSRGLGQADYLPLENILADPPEILLIAGEERAQRHPVLAQLATTRIASFDPSLLYCGGPTIIRAVERLAEIREELR
jgi:iron complex transport system substrate-binding protein